MALVTGGRLAAAVSRAGGLGIVAGGYAGALGGEPDLREELEHVKDLRFGVGFITWRPQAVRGEDSRQRRQADLPGAESATRG
jgi:NAD(P)H-dependent flavin oxidoreductase YrpB (nitropropane dioxygenase family)